MGIRATMLKREALNMQVLQFRIKMAACPVDRDPAVQKLLQLSNLSSLSVHLIVARGTVADGYRYMQSST